MSAPKSNSLYPFFDYCLQNSLPFALYRLPETNVIQVIAQKHNKLIKLPKGQNISAKKGFLFAPFQEDENYRRLLISPDIFTTADKLPALTFAGKTPKAESAEARIVKMKEATKQQYIVYVKNIQLNIKKGTFKKVVAARVVKRKKPGSFNAISFFETLCEKYPAAFTSLVYTPLYGLWIGATPEILLQVDNTGFKTYSLAGTKANTTQNANNAWGQKEKEEQKIVSRYVNDAFKKVTRNKPEIMGPETITAGNLLHLRTMFTFHKISKNKWPEVVTQLHPTPAVAGLPKKESIDYIQKHEIANRGYYSGYLGPINIDKQVNLFVNLRCMQVLKSKLAVYVGCGITSESKPQDEWKESKMKSETLLSVLKAAKK